MSDTSGRSAAASVAVQRKEAGSRIGVVHQISLRNGGVPKLPVREGGGTPNGGAGDRQRGGRHHGGPERAVCLYCLDVIERLRDEGHPIGPGAAGENIAVGGVDWTM